MPIFERSIEIDAPVEKVWEVLTDPRTWPEWFPGVDSVASVNTSVRVRASIGRLITGPVVRL